jgi:hypothetical protein
VVLPKPKVAGSRPVVRFAESPCSKRRTLPAWALPANGAGWDNHDERVASDDVVEAAA